MLEKPNKWPSSDLANSILFVAQTISELVNPQSYPSFRSKSLDLMQSISELRSTCENINSAGINVKNVECVASEVVNRLKLDKIYSDEMKFEFISFEKLIKDFLEKRASAFDIIHACNYFENRFDDNYTAGLRDYIIKNYRKKNLRGDLRSVLSEYISRLVSIGYSPMYIEKTVRERFFKDEIKKVDGRTLPRFFDKFESPDRLFHVWVDAPVTTANFVRKLGYGWASVVNKDKAPADVVAWQATADYFLYSQVYAKDHFSAVARFDERLSKIRCLTALTPVHVVLQWSDIHYVRTGSARTGQAIHRYIGAVRGLTVDMGPSSAKRVRRLVGFLENKFCGTSKERILNALSYAEAARRTLRSENKVVSIWSSFEILVRNPPVGQPRILHYRDILVPVICLKYGARTARIILKYAQKVNSDAVRNALDQVDSPYSNDVAKFGYLMANPLYSEINSSLFNDLSDNPLLQYRLWEFREKFVKPSAYLASIKSHEARVSWQIERIYRVRNQVVHAGQTFSYVDALIRNSEEYFRGTVGPVINRARFKTNSDIDDIFANLHIEYGAMKERLESIRSTDYFPIDDIHRFFT